VKRVQAAANRMSAIVKKAYAAAKRAKVPTRLLIMIDMIIGRNVSRRADVGRHRVRIEWM